MRAQKWEAIAYASPEMDQESYPAEDEYVNSFSPTANPISPGQAASVGGFSAREVEEEGAFGERTMDEEDLEEDGFGDVP